MTKCAVVMENPCMPCKRDHSRRLLHFARDLRRDQTDAERKMWSILRDRRFDGFRFRRQVPVAGYIVDYYCMRAGIVVELDGGQNLDPEHVRYDRDRTAHLNELGVQVVRFADDEVLKFREAVKQALYNEIYLTEPSSRPSPGVPGEGEEGAGAPV